jgi:hypothetical protein
VFGGQFVAAGTGGVGAAGASADLVAQLREPGPVAVAGRFQIRTVVRFRVRNLAAGPLGVSAPVLAGLLVQFGALAFEVGSGGVGAFGEGLELGRLGQAPVP